MNNIFQLFWLRESGCDAGTRVRADDLEPEIRTRVLDLAGDSENEITLRLPFMDRREWRWRDEILRKLPLERVGGMIQCVLPPAAATRNLAATLALTDPVWACAPSECEQVYFPTWRAVSVALQRSLRSWVAEEYFREIDRYQDRASAYPMVVFAVTRACYGRPRTEFTYDLSDYPDCKVTLAAAWKMIGNSLQGEMGRIETRLRQASMAALSRRYAPIWHHDVMAAVRKKPQRFVGLLAAEAALINALIGMGTERSVAAVNRFAKTANQSLRNFYGMDLRHLGVRVLHEATRILRAQQTSSVRENFIDGRIFEDRDQRSSGSPEFRIGD